MKKTILLIGLLGATTMALYGCSFSSAKPESAVQNAGLSADPSIALRNFPAQNVSLQGKTNLFIFWQLVNNQVRPSDVEAVVQLSQKIQADEDEQYNDNQLVAQLTASAFLPVGVDPIATITSENSLNIAPTALQNPKTLLASLDSQLAPAQAALNALEAANPADKTADDQINALTPQDAAVGNELAAEQALANPDPAKVAALQAQQAALDAQIATLRKTAGYRAYYAQANPLENTITGLSQVERVLQPDLIASWQEWVTAYNRSQAIVLESSDYITEIIGGTLSNGTVAPPHVMPVQGSSPPEMTIAFQPNGQIDMKIDQWFPPVGWESPDGSDTNSAPIFTTDDGSIQNVVYTELGGEYQFNVVTRWATYGFKIARTHYDAADGLQHYQGEINLYSDDTSQVLRGVAVLDQTSTQE